jgi:hypothetical protein
MITKIRKNMSEWPNGYEFYFGCDHHRCKHALDAISGALGLFQNRICGNIDAKKRCIHRVVLYISTEATVAGRVIISSGNIVDSKEYFRLATEIEFVQNSNYLHITDLHGWASDFTLRGIPWVLAATRSKMYSMFKRRPPARPPIALAPQSCNVIDRCSGSKLMRKYNTIKKA